MKTKTTKKRSSKKIAKRKNPESKNEIINRIIRKKLIIRENLERATNISKLMTYSYTELNDIDTMFDKFNRALAPKYI